MQIRLPELQLQMQIQIQALCICICICIINSHNILSMYALRSLWIDDWAAGHRRISSNRNEVIVLLLLSIWLVTSLVRSLYLSLHLSLFLSLSLTKKSWAVQWRPSRSMAWAFAHGPWYWFGIRNKQYYCNTLHLNICENISERERMNERDCLSILHIYIYINVYRERER